MSVNPIELEADSAERKYGDDAALYAQTRAQAAEQAGRKKSAEHWEQVEARIGDGEAEGGA